MDPQFMPTAISSFFYNGENLGLPIFASTPQASRQVFQSSPRCVCTLLGSTPTHHTAQYHPQPYTPQSRTKEGLIRVRWSLFGPHFWWGGVWLRVVLNPGKQELYLPQHQLDPPKNQKPFRGPYHTEDNYALTLKPSIAGKTAISPNAMFQLSGVCCICVFIGG